MNMIQQPLRATRSGTFDLPLPPALPFDLFTPEGERRWVQGWEPTMLGSFAEGTIWLTDMDGEHTIWTTIQADPANGRLLYSRVSPGRRAGTVRVVIAPIESGSAVTVSYDLTAIGRDGEPAVAAMDESSFAAMLVKWRELITAALDREGLA